MENPAQLWQPEQEWIFPAYQTTQRTRLRAVGLNLQKQRANLDIRKFSFSVRVTDYWNVLPATLKDAKSLPVFKNLYDKIFI